MAAFSRTDQSLVGQWWWTVDRWTLAALAALVTAGIILTMAATPAVAQRIGLDQFYFARRQFVYLPVAFLGLLLVSMLSEKTIRRMAAIAYVGTVLALVAVLLFGTDIKGATRWISIAGVSLQPSEFAKPAFAVLSAWVLAARRLEADIPGYTVSAALFGVIAGLLLLQPDVGQTIVLSAIWVVQLFLAGLPLMIVALVGLVFIAGGVGAYFVFDHVQARIDRFLDPAAGESYQVARALEAFMNGGLFGRGPGEGRVKEVLPDAHADFIFAVAGEEFGLIACLVIVGLFAFIVLRGFARVLPDHDLFRMLAVAGLLTQFGIQAMINIASSLHLMPTKGMTLPFISYGGSSVMALAFGMGMMLSLTRDRPNIGGPR